MCIDYRNLNDCTPDASWPIPVTVSSVACKLALARLCSNMLVPVLRLRVAID